jgi:Protein of unknown function (DUF3298)
MTSRNVVIALLGAAVIVGTAACGVSSRPIAITLITPSVTTSPTSPTTVSSGQPLPAVVAPSACTDLGGTVEEDQTCQVHTATSSYTLDFSFPVDYPDQRALTAALTKQRDQFIDLVGERPRRDTPYALAITGRAYRSGAPASGTESLVLEEYFDTGGAHPETYYESLNYDLGRAAPITFDTLFKPGTDPLGVLDPIVQRELANRVGGQADDNPVGATTYQNFALTDDAVIFFIGQGMWVMEAAGPQEVSVPRSELAAVLA